MFANKFINIQAENVVEEKSCLDKLKGCLCCCRADTIGKRE